jgi:hypothetical protein
MRDEMPPIGDDEPEYEDTINFALSKQSLDLIEQLAELGIYGESSAEVGARFVDRALNEFVECDMEPPPMTSDEESEIMGRRMTYEELVALQLPKIDFHDGPYEETINYSLSTQSLYVLDRLADLGIYGKTPGEVGARFVDRALKEFVQRPRFVVKRKEK